MAMRDQLEAMRKRINELDSVGKTTELAKLEQQVNLTQSQLDAEMRRKQEIERQLQQTDRRARELALQNIENKKDHEWMQSLAEKLENNLVDYQSKLDEAQQIAKENLKLYEITQRKLLETRQRAADAEAALRKYKNRSG